MAKLTEENVKQLAKSPKAKVICLVVVALILLFNIISSTISGKITPIYDRLNAQQAQLAAMEASIQEVHQMSGADEMKAILENLTDKSDAHHRTLQASYGLYKAELERLNELVKAMEEVLGDGSAGQN